MSGVSMEVKPISEILTPSKTTPKALFVFAHGAGADMHHEFMKTMTQLLVDNHISVLRFNFPFMIKRVEDGRRYPPDRMPKLINAYLSTLDKLSHDLPVFIGGKSMGGRVAATLAAEVLQYVKGVVCLGYPFHPQNKIEKLRLEPLQQTKLPILVIQGERDALGNQQEISEYVLSDLCDVKFLPDGDHNLKPRIKSGFTRQQHIDTTVEFILKFIDENIDENIDIPIGVK
jgi:predicted alpha/beta-hydrolase family hydrolase